MTNQILGFLVGAAVITALWSVLAWALVKLFRIHSPAGRFVIFLAPLLAAFVVRLRLNPGAMLPVLVLCVGVAVALLARDLLRCRALRRRIEAEARPAPAIQELVDELARSFKMRAPTALTWNQGQLGPFTGGIRRPYVVLTTELLSTLEPDELRVLLAHELAHVRRRDALWKWLLLFLRHLSFLNPAVHWPYRWLNLEMERSCDEAASAIIRKPGALARALLKVESVIAKRGDSCAPRRTEFLAHAESHLAARIHSLATTAPTHTDWLTLLKVPAVFLIFFTICLQPAQIWLKFFN